MRKYSLLSALLLIFALNIDAQPLPCQFSWSEINTESGTVDFTEDKGCQPFHGPCNFFSYVKAMEARFNIDTENTCRDFDFSIPYLEVAGYSINETVNRINAGLGVPEADCATEFFFPPITCDIFSNNPCVCKRSALLNQAVNQDLCIDYVEFIPDMELPANHSCQDHWNVYTTPMTTYRLYAQNMYEMSSSSTVDDVKRRIAEEGPMPIIIYPNVLNDFRPYGALHPNMQFHSFTLTGWAYNEDTNTTIWNINDHWPGNATFCGLGETLPVNNNDFEAYLGAGDIQIFGFENVYMNPSTPCGEGTAPFVVDWSLQDDCDQGGGPTDPKTPVVVDIENIRNGCLRGGTMNPMTAYVDCSIPADEYEWRAHPGGTCLGQATAYPCHSIGCVIPSLNIEEVTVSVRARQTGGEWSDWYFESFCVNNRSKGF